MFKKPSKKIQNIRKKVADQEEEGDEVNQLRLEDIKEIQKARERKGGLTEIECAVGKTKAAALEDGIQIQGGTMALSDKQKARLEAAGIEAGIRNQFAKESMLRDEHEELKKFIDDGLKRMTGGGLDDAVGSGAIEEVDAFQKAANKVKGFHSSGGNELLSENMLAGIPEVDLGINARISNILDTEKKKKEMVQRALNPDAFKEEDEKNKKPPRKRFRRE